MTAADLTKLIGAITVLLSTVLLPVTVNWLKNRSKSPLTQASVAQMFKDERDRLQVRLDELDARHQKQIDDLEVRHQREIQDLEKRHQTLIHSAETRIKELQAEVDRLYRRLYGQQPPAAPEVL